MDDCVEAHCLFIAGVVIRLSAVRTIDFHINDQIHNHIFLI